MDKTKKVKTSANIPAKAVSNESAKKSPKNVIKAVAKNPIKTVVKKSAKPDVKSAVKAEKPEKIQKQAKNEKTTINKSNEKVQDNYFNQFPLVEFDAISKPVVEARDFRDARKRISRCLVTYFQDIVDKYDAAEKLSPAFVIRTEGLRPQVYEMQIGNEFIYVLLTAGGAPNAAKALECMSAFGVKKFMVCAGAGTLDDKVTLDRVLIPVAAVRDEGTSYHYMPAQREIKINSRVQKTIENVLQKADTKFTNIKTWTTDAPYRETQNKIQTRQKEGCSAVEMECAAYYAVAEHKNLLCGELLFAGDIIKKDGWDYRIWHTATDLREKLFDLAVKCLMAL